jgi:hypothetical protein
MTDQEKIDSHLWEQLYVDNMKIDLQYICKICGGYFYHKDHIYKMGFQMGYSYRDEIFSCSESILNKVLL